MRICPSCGARFTQEARFCPQDGTPTEERPDVVEKGDPLIGQLIEGRYRVEKVLGRGGMGVVYTVTHAVLGKKMALKVLRADMARDPDVVQRFVQEAQTSSSIGHPNIVDISDFGRLPDGSVYFVMEHLEGEPLTDLMARRGALDPAVAIDVASQIASALGAAHARGVVHRDLKPDNVFLVGREGTQRVVKVLDFGIAKVGNAGTKLTQTGMVFGTPHYMSPEQAAGQPVDARADIYALGIILYEMVAGRVPFDAETFMGILSKHMFEPPPSPSTHASDPRLGALEPVILRALAKKPEDRYSTMDAVLADLERVRDGTAPAAAHWGMSSSYESGFGHVVGSMLGIPRPLRPKRRDFYVASGILLALLGAGAFAGALYAWSGHTPDGPAPIVVAPPLVAPSPVATARPPEPPSAPDVPEATVELRSFPAGASVLVDGALIGRTPLEVPLPLDTVTEYELRQPGYRREIVEVGPDDTDPIEVELVALRAGRRRRPPSRSTMTEPAPTSRPTYRPRRELVDVVDPWAN